MAAGRTTGRWLIPSGVFVVAALLYLVSPVNQTTDSFWVVYTATSLIDHGDVTLDEYPAALAAADGFQVDEVDGHAYYSVPLATSVLAVPLVATALAVDGDEVRAELERGEPPSLDRFLAAFVAAASIAVAYLFARDLSGRVPVALVASGVLALGTAAWSTASRAMWMHGPSMLAVALVVLLLPRVASREQATTAAVALGSVAALAVAIRPTNAVLAVGVVLWIVLKRRQALVAVLGGATAVALVAVLANLVLLGTPIPRYARGGRLDLTSSVPEALLGNLVSPARGLLVYSPVLVLVVAGVLVKHRRAGLTSVDAVFGAVVVGHLVVVSLFPHWWGGWGFGPRFMVDVLPILVWFLVPAIDVCLDRSADGRGATALRVSFVGLAVLSVWINSRGALRQETFAWNHDPVSVDVAPDRLWDWSDPPFLR